MSFAKKNFDLNKTIKKFQTGKQTQAYSDIKKHIRLNPSDLIALYNFAYMSEKLNKIDVAINIYKDIISKDQNHWRSIFNLYIIYINKKKYEKAIDLINKLLVLKPSYQPALRDKALIKYYQGRPDRALTLINNSLKINPNDYVALNILGLIYGALKFEKKAIEVFETAIKISPDYFASYNNLGNFLYNQGNLDLAIKNFKKAINLNNNFMEAHNNLANIYNLKGKYNEAIELYKKSLKFEPENPTILYNIGVTYSYLKDFVNAEKFYNNSLKINPNSETLKKNLSIMYLAKHEFKKAWEYYDGRLKLDDFAFKNSTIDNIRNKLWSGNNISQNDKILIIKEQGVGDEILHSSMFPDLLKMFPKSKIETEDRLLSIFKRSFKNNNNFFPFGYFSKKPDLINKFDKILYSGSLARLFRNSYKDFPQNPYLIPDKKFLINLKNQISYLDNYPKIGITWESKRVIYGDDKSISLKLLLPLLKIKKFNFINLQYGNIISEIKNFNKINNININIIEDIDLYNDFEKISALLYSLDLFITVSNSTAHLAGALGVPTWLIKPKNHAVFHYWNQPKNQTPWYNSINLFEYKDSWAETINQIKNEFYKKFKIRN